MNQCVHLASVFMSKACNSPLMIQLKILIDMKPKGQILNIPESISKIEKQGGKRLFLSALISLRLPHNVHPFTFQICLQVCVLALAYFKKAGKSRVVSGLAYRLILAYHDRERYFGF